MKQLIKKGFKKLGIEILRIDSSERRLENTSYFQFPENCQIPNLGYIYEIFFGKTPKSLVEIGAYDGINYSNSSGLIENGWTAILIEPIPIFALAAKSRYINRTNVTVLECAVSDKEELLEFQIAGPLTSANKRLLDEYTRISWAAPTLKFSNEKTSISAITLASILNQPESGYVDLLIVDVEGFEDKVFATFEQIKNLPNMIIVEMTELHPDFKYSIRTYLEIRNLIEVYGYKVIYKDSINTIFVKNELYKSKLFV